MENKREYKHPLIDHIFQIKDISSSEIEIDGIKVYKKDLDVALTMVNHRGSNININDLSLPILQHVLAAKKLEKLENLLK